MRSRNGKVSLSVSQVRELVSCLEWAGREDGLRTVENLLEDVDGAVGALVPMLSNSNDHDTVLASFALDGMVMQVLRGQDGDGRANGLGTALARMLGKAKDDTARAVIVKCLQQLGDTACVPVLGRYLLKGEPMFSHSLNALRSISGELAADTLHEAFLKADGKARALLCAAMLEAEVVSDELLDEALDCLLETDDPALARLLMGRLASRGCAEIADKLLHMLHGISRVDAAQARRALLTLVCEEDFFINVDDEYDGCEDDGCGCEHDGCEDGGCEDGSHDAKSERLEEICRRFHRVDSSPASLYALAIVLGECDEVFEALCKALRSRNAVLRAAANGVFKCMFSGVEHTQRLVGIAAGLRTGAKADMLYMLGSRKDMVARPFVMSCLSDKSSLVRQAALEVARKLPGNVVSEGMLAALKEDGME